MNRDELRALVKQQEANLDPDSGVSYDYDELTDLIAALHTAIEAHECAPTGFVKEANMTTGDPCPCGMGMLGHDCAKMKRYVEDKELVALSEQGFKELEACKAHYDAGFAAGAASRDADVQKLKDAVEHWADIAVTLSKGEEVYLLEDLEQARLEEREACLEIVERLDIECDCTVGKWDSEIAAAIRARTESTP